MYRNDKQKQKLSHPQSSVEEVNHYLKSWQTSLSQLTDLMHLSRQYNPYEKRPSTSVSLPLHIRGDFEMMWEEQCGINFPVDVSGKFISLLLCPIKRM